MKRHDVHICAPFILSLGSNASTESFLQFIIAKRKATTNEKANINIHSAHINAIDNIYALQHTVDRVISNRFGSEIVVHCFLFVFVCCLSAHTKKPHIICSHTKHRGDI